MRWMSVRKFRIAKWTSKWHCMMLHNHAWVYVSFKEHSRTLSFNETECKIDMISDSILERSFKKQSFIMFWCSSKEDLQLSEKAIKILSFCNCKSVWGQISSYTSTKTSCNRLNAEAVMKIQLSFSKPDIKEICKKKKKKSKMMTLSKFQKYVVTV